SLNATLPKVPRLLKLTGTNVPPTNSACMVTLPESRVAPGVKPIWLGVGEVIDKASKPPWPLMAVWPIPVAEMATGPAPVIVAVVRPVGAKLIELLAVVPLTVSVSPAEALPPLTTMLVRPVGLFGLLRLTLSVPRPVLIVSDVLL